MFSFWDSVDEAIRAKPRLYVNLLSAACVENMGIDYEQYIRSFVNAVNVDYAKIRKTGTFMSPPRFMEKVQFVFMTLKAPI
jgi:hypothetical protein